MTGPDPSSTCIRGAKRMSDRIRVLERDNERLRGRDAEPIPSREMRQAWRAWAERVLRNANRQGDRTVPEMMLTLLDIVDALDDP